MKLVGYLIFPVLVLLSVSTTNAQQNSVQASVSAVISCVSLDNQRQQCPADTSAGIVMLRQKTETSCLLGRNWGYDAQGVWVSEGCGGEFATGSTSRAAAIPAEGNALIALQDEQSEMATVTTGTNPEVRYTGVLNPYGSFRTIIGSSDAGAQVQDDASRVGINFSTFGPIKVFGTAEWGVDLVQSETQFNASATTNSRFGVLTTTTNPVFGARYGFVGIDFGAFGRLSFGKQNSVHYDVTGYTDRFNVFGGQSTATYVAGTDGGDSGTGRADQTILYHVSFLKIMELGAQAQLRSAAASTAQSINGFGFSLQAKVLPGVKLGASYVKTYFNPELTQAVFDGGRTDYWAFGGTGNWRNLQWGAVYVHQDNGDLVFVPDPAGGPEPIAAGFSANGVELYSKLNFGRFAVIGGFDDYIPFNFNPLINPNLKTRYGVLGAEWHFSKSGYTFIETRLGDTIDLAGKEVSDALAIGFRYDFSWKTLHVE